MEGRRAGGERKEGRERGGKEEERNENKERKKKKIGYKKITYMSSLMDLCFVELFSQFKKIEQNSNQVSLTLKIIMHFYSRK